MCGCLLLIYWLRQPLRHWLDRLQHFVRQKDHQRQKIACVGHFCDILLMQITAGRSLQAAIQGCLEIGNLSPLHPLLKEVSRKVELGVALPRALQEMADESGLDSIARLARVCKIGYQSGGSITNSIRKLSQQFSEQRYHRAELAASKLSIKILAPLCICIFPATFVVLMFPVFWSFTNY